ncbi:hypothetical protein LAZ67_7001042 [Cordylochernes scorpioides]|uniref:Helix-turn-helix domain-containing protein n=1 Tax=Cordylochernes scorpioides TaxID=51811 RepID=A0ABY6KLX0_9ARAC|nr:hypothetical protein LAZ67_7001042 [Cordylochernes scorpioides]
MEQRAVIKFNAKLGISASETYILMKQVYGTLCLSKSNVFIWHKRFSDGRNTLEDDKHTGRPSSSKTPENPRKNWVYYCFTHVDEEPDKEIGLYLCEQHESENNQLNQLDDIFCIITENSENHILETLNSFNSSIQFTIEKENKRSLPFLDILFTRNRTSFTTKVYRKPTSPTQYLHFASNSPISHKITVVRTLTKRAFTHCSSKIEYNKELKSIENQLLKSGYPLPFIKRNRYKPGTPRNNSNQYISTCYLPYIESTITIARKLKGFGIKTIFRGSPSMASILRNPITKSTDQKQKKRFSLPNSLPQLQ